MQSALAGEPIGQPIDYLNDPTAREVLHLEGVAGAGIQPGDRVVVLLSGEPVGAGAVSRIDDGQAVATLEFVDRGLPQRGQALVISRELPDRLGAWLPPFVTRMDEGDSRAGGQDSGQANDQASVHRPNVQPLVLAVEVGPQRARVRLTNSDATLLAIGDRLDLFRGWRYVGFAKVVSIDEETAEAEMLESLSALPAQVGDLTVRRSPHVAGKVRRGYVFRIEDEYALVSLGEADGVKRGDRLWARDNQGRDRRLTVERIYPDHCGVSLESVGAATAGTLSLWQPVSLELPVPAFFELPLGAVQPAEVTWLASVKTGTARRHLRVGDFVLVPETSPVVGVVLVAEEQNTQIYFPGVWMVGTQGAVGHDRGGRQ